jgi:hypothetical protein
MTSKATEPMMHRAPAALTASRDQGFGLFGEGLGHALRRHVTVGLE